MNVMRRLKSIASGRSSVSDHGGDSSIKRVNVEQDTNQRVSRKFHSTEKCATSVEQHMESASRETTASTRVSSIVRPEKSDLDELPLVMHEMKISENTSDIHGDKDIEATVVSGNGTETGQIIVTLVGGRNGQKKQTMSYMAERVVGTGSFGVVYQAKCLETGEAVAIKKVLQDKRYKNRELQIMCLLEHPNVVQLKHLGFLEG